MQDRSKNDLSGEIQGQDQQMDLILVEGGQPASTTMSGDKETHNPVVTAADDTEKGYLENAPNGDETAQRNTFVHRVRRRLTQRRTGSEEWNMPKERHKNCKKGFFYDWE